jgi:hypothetical protein
MSFPSATGAYSQKCLCGRIFTLPAAFKNHQNSCLTSKNELSAVLARSKETLQIRKAKKATLRNERNMCSESRLVDESQVAEGSASEVSNHALTLPTSLALETDWELLIENQIE